ncbi:MAG: hypothetical protein HQL13_00510 [Candidatus Omnitrophica bacterium]|nr:hypothetical protein [Candidatus Omnitrophota bacterium]
MKNRLHSDGFTVIELLLGLTIGAIIGLCVSNMFWLGLKLNDKMQYVHKDYVSELRVDATLSRDLENAVFIDLSNSYPDAKIFEGNLTEFSFLTQTSTGLKRVRYFTGSPEGVKGLTSMIGRVVNPSNIDSKGRLDQESLFRQESSLGDWLTGSNQDTRFQIIAGGLKKQSFHCQYAPFVKNLDKSSSKEINYKDVWDDKKLPLSVSCGFVLYNLKNPSASLIFKRNFFLAPVNAYYNEQ